MSGMEEREISCSIVSVEEELSPLRAKGYWWRPGTDQKVPGEVVLSHGGNDASLHLFGRPDETKGFDGFLRGCVHPSRHVALINCQEYQRNTSCGYGVGTEVASLSFIDMWIGELGFDSSDEIAFLSLSFGITNLNVWLNRGCFPSMKGTPNQFDFQRLIFEDELVSIYLTFGPIVSVVDPNGCSQAARREPCVVIVSKNGLLPYYGATKSFEYYERRMVALFALLIGRDAVRYGCCGRAECSLSESVKTTYAVWRWNRRHLPSKLVTPLKRDSLFIPYEEIAEDLPRIAENFFKMDEEVVGICCRLAYFRAGESMIPYGGVPELVFMFEGLARNLYGDEVKRTNEQLPEWPTYSANKKKVEELLKNEPELLQWLSRRMKFKYPKIADWFGIARTHMPDAFYYLEDDCAWGEFTKYLRARRDGFAHSETKCIEHDKMYVAAYFWLESFMMGMVLLDCGVPASVVSRGVSRCSDFQYGICSYYDEFVKVSNETLKEV